MPKSTKSVSAAKPDKPSKPYPDFPLFAHQTRRWAKKIRGKTHYFGPWDDPDAALERYLREKDYLHTGRVPPRGDDEAFLIKDLCNHFLTHKLQRVRDGELTQRSFNDYQTTCDRIVRVFGKQRRVDDLNGADFEKLRADITKTRGPVATQTEITRAKVVFKYGFKADLIDRPVKFGAGFDPPSAKVMRKERNKRGPRMFEAEDLRALLDAASQPLKAMILIGINSGMGNHDIGLLTLDAVDLDSGWVDFPREKTGAPRRFKLWAEAVAAIQEYLAHRPEPRAGHEAYLFLTRKRQCWTNIETTSGTLSREFTKLLKEQEQYRQGLGFYCLRRTFQTIGEEAGETACRFIMGHIAEPGDMSAAYRQRISDKRLVEVTDYVHDWLFATRKKKIDHVTS